MNKHLLFVIVDLLIVIVPMLRTEPLTINVVTIPTGVWFCYDNTGLVEFHGDYEYDFGPSQIHHYVRAEGDRLFLFIIQTGPQERVLVRADSKERARTRFALWASSRGKSVKMDALDVHEVFE